MTTEKNIENKLEELAQAIAPDETLIENVMSRIDTKSTASPSAVTIQNIWRTIMKSPITKFAAATVIVIAVLIGIHPFNGSLNGTTAAYAKVKEKIKNVPWIHISYTGYILDEIGNKKSEEGQLDTEIWYSFKSQIVIQKYPSGLIEYCDYANQEVRTYNPTSKRIVITALSSKKFPVEADTPWSWLERNIQRMMPFGGEVTRKTGQYDGQEVEVFEIVSAVRPNMASIQGKIFVDMATSLPIAEERKYINTEIGKPQRIETGTFDYPEHGPDDIYAIGLPRDTPIVNSLPLPSWWDIKPVSQSRRLKAPERYIAIVTSELSILGSPISDVEVCYTDGEYSREERHHMFQPGPVGVQWRQQAAEIGNTFDSILKWSQACKAHGPISISIYDGNYYYNSRREYDGIWKTTKQIIKGRKWTAGDFWHICPIAEIGWPEIRGYADVLQDDYAKQNDLICIEELLQGWRRQGIVLPRRKRYYLNPQRDYICQRLEIESVYPAHWQDDDSWLEGVDPASIPNEYSSTIEVTEFSQSQTGHWYPRKIKEPGKTRTVYLETDPEFPEGIFEPENLPK
ncbi:MAG: hypothetical protein HQ580_16010 [Planctomycetes bacterium]|nr:hypothetical protein [Planctomycetota bacterium]